MNQIPADIVFVIDEKPHDIYKRDGHDLVLRHNVLLVDALAGTTLKLKTLDGRDLTLMLPHVVTPGFKVEVVNEGMPVARAPGMKGNLRIRFDVTFPSRLTEEQRTGIRRILGGSLDPIQ